MTTGRLHSLGVAGAALLTVAAYAGPAQAQTFTLHVRSEAGGPAGPVAREWTFTNANAALSARRHRFETGPGVNVELMSDSFWSLDFDAAARATLGVGEQLGARSYPFHGFAAGLKVQGPFGCFPTTTGRFTVLELQEDSSGNITRFAADFEQHCGEADPALIGVIRYNSTVASLEPFAGAYPDYRLIVPRPAHGTVTGGGIACAAAQDPCMVTFATPTSVTLTATADAGYAFLGWAPICTGGSTTTVRVNQPTRCEAIFASTSAPITTLFVDKRTATPATFQFNESTSAFTATRIDTSLGAGVEISVGGETSWTIDFDAAKFQALTAGLHPAARRYSVNGVMAGFRLSGPVSVLCFSLTGSFLVRELETGANGSVVRFAADFEQHCDDEDAGVFGAIRFNSTIASTTPFDGDYPRYSLTVSPAPVNGTVTGSDPSCTTPASTCVFASPTPLTLTATPNPGFVFLGWGGDCSGTATTTVRVNQPKVCEAVFQSATSPAPYSSLVMDSQAGDFVGQGRQWFYNGVNAQFTVGRVDTSNGAGVQVTVAGEKSWSLTFDAAARQPLTIGTWLGATRYPFNGFRPGLDVWGDSRSCGQISGWFVVHELVFATDGSVARFAADFEQHCSSLDPGLFGAVRYNSTVPSTVPFGGAYPAYRLTIATPLHGSVTGDGLACSATQASCVRTLTTPAVVALTATPDPGFVFLGWTGSCLGGAATTIRVNQTMGCGAVFQSATSPPPYTSLFMDSRPGDFVGQGRQWFYNDSNATFTASRIDFSNGLGVQIGVTADTSWTVRFDANANDRLVPGTYYGAIRFPFNRFRAGLDISGDGRGCNRETGWFIVRQLEVAPDGSIVRFAADAEQHCENNDAGLFVAIRYNSTIPSPLPFDGAYPDYRLIIGQPAHGRIVGDGIACGPSQAECVRTLTGPASVALTAIPDPGYVFLGWIGSCDGGAAITVRVNQRMRCDAYFDSVSSTPRTTVFFDSQAGDYIGQGRQWLYNSVTAKLNVTRADTFNGAGVTVQVSAETDWTISFDAHDRGPLAVGPYNRAIRYPFNDLRSGLSISGDGRGCNQLSGRFIILELEFDPFDGSILRFAADFEQHCEMLDPALFGSVRYNSTVPVIAPFGGRYPERSLTILRPAHGRVIGGTIDCGPAQTECTQALSASADIVLTAIADPGYALRGWTEDCSGTRVTTVRVNTIKVCAPVFVPTVIPHDLDGDRAGDIAIWRPENGTWYWGTSSSGFNDAAARAKHWGSAALGDVPFLGDVDGDALEDLIVWRASSGTWFWLPSSGGYEYATARSVRWGSGSLGDIPMIGDMDGDGRTDFVVWRPGNGTFYWLTSSTAYSTSFARGIQWGNQALGDRPLLGDFDGDGLQDLVIWRASTGTWYWLPSTANYNYIAARAVQWGSQAHGDIVFTGDLDGDARSEVIVWRPGTGTWYWLLSSTGYAVSSQQHKQWGSGAEGDQALLADFDGDRRLDLGVWRRPSGTWFVLTSSSGYSYAAYRLKTWGVATDIPMLR